MLKNIRFQGRYFPNETNLELFQDNDRMSLIYGKNGSGKSTISNAILKAIGNNIEGIECATLFTEDGTVYSESECIHVFNEAYVNEKVKLKEDGLNTIVLLGELGNIENKISELQLRKKVENKKNDELKIKYEEYDDINNQKSPKYCKSQINLGLSGETHWADREKQIKDGKRNASVMESIIDNIVKCTSKESRGVIQERFNKNIHLLKEVRKNHAIELKNTVPLNLNYNEENLQTLLKQKVERPNLSEREENLLRMIEDGKVEQVIQIKKIFSKDKTAKCPFCFQEIADDYKENLVESIKKVLSKEFDEHEEKLRECIILNPETDFSDLEKINTKNVLNCKDKIEEIKNEIFKIKEVVLKKINHPYTPIVDFESNLIDKLEEYEELRIKLQSEVDKYNNAVNKIGTLTRSLSEDNVAIARYEVERDIKRWNQSLEEQGKVKKELEASSQLLMEYNFELETLVAQKKNTKIAVDLINKSLRYVFFSKDRLEIKVENEKYILYSRGVPVKPDSVSMGERNIIALCYFFTELISNQEAKDGYAKKLLLVIDDPVSSFDFENKVGIMSLMKDKLSTIVKNNDESQIFILTHDMQCFYDFQKISGEISKEVQKESNGHKKMCFRGRELKDKSFVAFNFSKHNEYSELFKIIYNYACGNTTEYEFVIGNVMRRTLEAFSTFLYKKGIEEVSIDQAILAVIDDSDFIDYFKNLMYRLVLHGESHMEERVKALEDTDYLEFISTEAKERTAQEVVCFMYKLNQRHVLAHLEGEKDVNIKIHEWLNNIKTFYIEM